MIRLLMLTHKNTCIHSQGRQFHEYEAERDKNDQYNFLLVNMTEQEVNANECWCEGKSNNA